jgi:hypothetical protein
MGKDMTEYVADIFKTVGQPSVTYVQRDSGRLEKQLRNALNERGQLCLVTGPSKTGKTTLYKEVLKDRGEFPLVVQCDRSQTAANIWRQALELVDFERVESRNHKSDASVTGEIEASGKIGWAWLAEMAGRLRFSGTHGVSDGDIRARVLADPGPDLLIPVLRETTYVLVIEDFHYLPDEQKEILFQQWKRFTDNEISVLVLGTTHRAVDIANSNRDLVGRICQIDVGHWEPSDLAEICRKGLKYLQGTMPAGLINLISSEAVGLPIIVQQVCQSIYTARDLNTVRDARKAKLKIKADDIERALHEVARQKYTQFENYYNTLISGPREKARKYRTYELILACFTLDPIKFQLKRLEIDQRLSQLVVDPTEMPPAASLNSTFGALKTFQEKRGFEILEWRLGDNILYILEPTFLFYVRWRTPRTSKSVQLDFFEKLVISTSFHTWGDANLPHRKIKWEEYLSASSDSAHPTRRKAE